MNKLAVGVARELESVLIHVLPAVAVVEAAAAVDVAAHAAPLVVAAR
jgi:hypothetical protein